MNTQKLTNPFSSATVVMSDDFVDTFPHPRGLLAYLYRLCLQLDVDIVSLERPVTVKGSWKTIIKIDAFLKTLISTLNDATVDTALEEDYFNAAFANFEVENNYVNGSLVITHTSQSVHDSNGLSELKTDEFLEVIKTDEDNLDTHVLDKWYFNSNPRGKTTDNKRQPCSGKIPPEPFVIVEADNTIKERKASLVEIEQVLSQVYKKETIEKYQQKSYCNDRQSQETVLDEVNSVKEIAHNLKGNKHALKHKPLKAQSDTENTINISPKNHNMNSFKCAKDVTLENELEIIEPLTDDVKEKTIGSVSPEIYDKDSELPVPRRVTRQTNSANKKIAESMSKNLIAHKEQRGHGRSRKKRQTDQTNTEEVHQMTKQEGYKDNTKVKQQVYKSNWKSPRHNKAAAEGSSHQTSQIRTNVSKQRVEMEKIKERSENILVKTKIKTSLKRCEYVEKNKEARNLHRREIVNSQYKCDKCSYLTTKQLQLFEHKRRVHLAKKYRCEECQKEFGFRKDLRRHMKCHRKADNCCDKCGKMYKDVRKLSEHKRIHVEGYVKPEFPCKFCSKIFSTKYVLAYHVKYDHLGMKRSYMCPTCGKSFSQKYSYIQHANVHLGIKPFSCDVCGKKFSYEKSLKEHKLIHNEEKVYSCTFCNKSFRQSSGLSIHLKVHKTTKDYVCSMCGKGFTQKQALVRHERIHEGDKPYECGICKRTFADSSVLRRHMILIHKRDPKLWRQDTLFHVPRRSDFFISVLNEDSLHSNNSGDENSGKMYSKKLEQNICWQQENKQQNQFQQNQPVAHNVENIIPSNFDDVIFKNTQSSVTVPREPIVAVAEIFAEATSVDVKPYFGYVSQKDVATSSVITSTAETTNHLIDTGLFSSSALHSHSTLPMHNSIALPAHCERSVMAHPNHTPITVHPLQTQSPHISNLLPFLPLTCNQRPVSYDTNNIQQVPYSTMMTQPYSHTILVHQDSFGAIAYHQPEINTSFSHENHQQHINPTVTLPCSPDSSTMDVSKAVSSDLIYDQVLSIDH